MSAAKQSPAVVIAVRSQLITELGEHGGDRMTQPQRESVADWLISSGYLSELYYEAVAARIGETPA